MSVTTDPQSASSRLTAARVVPMAVSGSKIEQRSLPGGEARQLGDNPGDRGLSPNRQTALHQAPPNSSSSAFASLRSGVSKPSVNQP